MLSHQLLKVLATVYAFSFFSAIRANPEETSEAPFVLDVTVPGEFEAAEPVIITRLTSVTPPTIGDGLGEYGPL